MAACKNLIACVGSKAQVVIFHFYFDVFCGALLASTKTLFRRNIQSQLIIVQTRKRQHSVRK